MARFKKRPRRWRQEAKARWSIVCPHCGMERGHKEAGEVAP